MTTTEGLKRQIQTAEDLLSVVKTMKTLSAVSIRQYERAVASLAEYAQTVDLAIQMYLWEHPQRMAPANSSKETAVGLIIFGSDQGMCGGFNEQIVTHALDRMSALKSHQQDVRLLAVGIRAAEGLRGAKVNVDRVFEVPGSVTGITLFVQELLPEVERWQREQELGSVRLIYNRRHARSAAVSTETALFPFEPPVPPANRRTWPGRSLPLLTMPPEELVSAIARQYFFVSLFRATAESLASENASRIAAMQAAEKNIQERLGTFHFHFQQLRQTSITEELLDVVTGFEALNSARRI